MRPEDFDLFAQVVKQRSGLVLSRDKAYFVESRLLAVARKYNLKSLEDVAQAVRSSRDEKLMSAIAEAMTTNETYFFRDHRLFKEFRETILPQLIANRMTKQQLRIWSAAGSSGQEAYSLAMMCAEDERLAGWKIEILCTDISREMIERAKLGIYSQFEVQRGLPIRMLVKHFQQIAPDKWQIKENMRHMVQCREANLLADFGPVGIFDIVFCRNIVMYLDQPAKIKVLHSLSHIMAPDGVLLLGGPETVHGAGDKLKPINADNGFHVLAGFQGFPSMRQAS
jgi:chemotaxis protein methyltransferase CheR